MSSKAAVYVHVHIKTHLVVQGFINTLVWVCLLQTLLVQVWYPMTVATNSRYQKEIIAKFLHETADDLKSLPFKLHDFGFRGSTSVEVSILWYFFFLNQNAKLYFLNTCAYLLVNTATLLQILEMYSICKRLNKHSMPIHV